MKTIEVGEAEQAAIRGMRTHELAIANASHISAFQIELNPARKIRHLRRALVLETEYLKRIEQQRAEKLR